jgi:hypothetical protein
MDIKKELPFPNNKEKGAPCIPGWSYTGQPNCSRTGESRPRVHHVSRDDFLQCRVRLAVRSADVPNTIDASLLWYALLPGYRRKLG